MVRETTLRKRPPQSFSILVEYNMMKQKKQSFSIQQRENHTGNAHLRTTKIRAHKNPYTIKAFTAHTFALSDLEIVSYGRVIALRDQGSLGGNVAVAAIASFLA